MGVSQKGKRYIKYNALSFVWWVSKYEDLCDSIWLNIVSDDKSIILAYRVGEGDFSVTSKGRIFQGKPTSGCWERYCYPMDEPPMIITPKFVYNLIAWAVDGRNAVRTDKIRQ